MLDKVLNEIAHVLNTKILISADIRTRSKHEDKFHIMTKNIDKYKYSFFSRTISQYSGTVYQKH